jgi:hypothetical protein
MSLMERVRHWWKDLRGDWIDDIVDEVRAEGQKTRDHINDVYNRATLNGEDEWFRRTEKHNEEGCSHVK